MIYTHIHKRRAGWPISIKKLYVCYVYAFHDFSILGAIFCVNEKFHFLFNVILILRNFFRRKKI